MENYTAFDYPFDRIKRLYDINVHAAFFTAREAARNMIPGGGGSIVLVSSMSANVSNYFIRCSATLPLDLASPSNCQEEFYISISSLQSPVIFQLRSATGRIPHLQPCFPTLLAMSESDTNRIFYRLSTSHNRKLPTTLPKLVSCLLHRSGGDSSNTKLFSPQLSSTWLHHWP